MDYMKNMEMKYIGPGGIKCDCCRPFNKNKKFNLIRLHRSVRRILKQQLNTILKKEEENSK